MEFPMYDELKEMRSTESVDWKTISNICKQLPQQHLDNIYLLILHHSTLEEQPKKNKKSGIPYNGKVFDDGNGVFFSLPNLPDTLLEIISRYIQHISQ